MVILQGEEDDNDAAPTESVPSTLGTSWWRRALGGGMVRRRPTTTRPPLRLLVIGDSLAAGVGTAQSGSPALPHSLAHALSRPLGGLPVYWTCVGTPGWSATEVAQGIHNLPNLPTPIVRRLVDWQASRKRAARHRLETATDRAQHWYHTLGTPVSNAEKEEPSPPLDPSTSAIAARVRQRVQRAQRGVQRDWSNFLRIFGPPATKGDNADLEEPVSRIPPATEIEEEHDESSVERSRVSGHNQQHIERGVRGLVRRNRLDPSFVNQYDVAVVLTGLNDLKDAWLPWTVSAQRARTRAEAQRLDGSSGGIGDELLRIVRTLKATVLAPLEGSVAAANAEVPTTPSPAASVPQEPLELEREVAPVPPRMERPRTGPLIVFPALPMEPIELNHRAPLSWFVAPLVRAMDLNKQILAERYPDLVLFVPSPQSTVFSDAEARRGPLWDSFQKEAVLLSLTDLVHTVHDRLDELWHRPYRPGWALESTDAGLVAGDAVASASLYTLQGDDVVLVPNRSPARRWPGASMVSPDGIHPNDQGYDLWGKFIAGAIVEHWEMERTVTATL